MDLLVAQSEIPIIHRLMQPSTTQLRHTVFADDQNTFLASGMGNSLLFFSPPWTCTGRWTRHPQHRPPAFPRRTERVPQSLPPVH